MKLSRRVLIRYMSVGMAGYVLLPSCTGSGGEPEHEASGKIGLDAGDEANVAALCAALIPLKAFGGEMESAGLHPFVLKMVADCENPENQQRFKTGLRQFSEMVKSKTGHSIKKSTAADLMPVLQDLEAARERKDDLAFFYRLTKSLTIRGYKGSKFFLTQVQPYKLVPGKYQGCSTI